MLKYVVQLLSNLLATPNCHARRRPWRWSENERKGGEMAGGSADPHPSERAIHHQLMDESNLHINIKYHVTDCEYGILLIRDKNWDNINQQYYLTTWEAS